MVGKFHKKYSLEDILSEHQVDVIIKKALGNNQWKLVRSEIKPASDGIAGFMGDHMKGALHVEAEESGDPATVHIFIKQLPTNNKPKADFIIENYLNKRESLVFSLVEEFEAFDSNQYLPKAYIYTDTLLVLPDLTVQGYATRHYLHTLDLAHVLVTVTALARFHAAYANYETKKCVDGVAYNIMHEHGDIMTEATLKESLWLRKAAELTTNFLTTFSTKYKSLDMEKVFSLFVEACDSLRDYEDTVNVLVHKDLWMNNIMFKYENGAPVNAVLVDFQSLRYGPPAFDLMIFLYLTTSRSFRETYEGQVIRHYYKTFCDSLDDATKARITRLGYDKRHLLDWCERSRLFAMVGAIVIFPFVLMDPKTAEKKYDDPETFVKNVFVDRSGPVIAYAQKFQIYRETQIEVCEDFIEKYILKEQSES